MRIGADLGGTKIEAAALGDESEFPSRTPAMVIGVVDRDVIAPGGDLPNSERLYCGMPEKPPAQVFSDRLDTPVLAPGHGASSGVRGAAWLWPPGGSELAEDGAGP